MHPPPPPPTRLLTQPVGTREEEGGKKGQLWIELMSLDWEGGGDGEGPAWEFTILLPPSKKKKKKGVQQMFLKDTDSLWWFPVA